MSKQRWFVRRASDLVHHLGLEREANPACGRRRVEVRVLVMHERSSRQGFPEQDQILSNLILIKILEFRALPLPKNL